MTEKHLTVNLVFPITWQQEGVIQREIFRAEKLLNERATEEEQQAIWRAWRGEQGLLRYRGLELQILEGNPRVFPEIGTDSFELITAVLLLALRERIHEASGETKCMLIMMAYRFALNLAHAKSISVGRDVRQKKKDAASRPRKKWSRIDPIYERLRTKIARNNLAAAIVKALPGAGIDPVSERQVRDHYGIGPKKRK